MAAKKKRAKKPTVSSKIKNYSAKVKKAAAAKPGAYQTHKGGVVLNSKAPASVRAAGKAFNAAQRALSSKKAPPKGKQTRGNRRKK
jgi:hypothetical protein